MSTLRQIDLNADLGERPEAFAHDAALLREVTSVNVACGGHAGDGTSMRTILKLAKECGVAVGAHPSFPDRENFGRIELTMDADDLRRTLEEQIRALLAIAEEVGIRVQHVKPHGALYHSANHDPQVARTIASVVGAIDSSLVIVGQAGSPVLPIYRESGLRTASEAFADRAYESNGELRDRRLPGALLETPQEAALQALDIVNGFVKTADGNQLQVAVDTLCIHSDTPNSLATAREIRAQLSKAGVSVQCLRTDRR